MNNRQPNRRRGRGNNNNNRQQNNRGGGGGFDHQNRIDNRARGNAGQLLEKYKKLAQDSQMNDDRVNTEYYHQFADHYFRVQADFKARQDEKHGRGSNDRDNDSDDDSDHDDSDSNRRGGNRQQRGNQQNDARGRGAREDDDRDDDDFDQDHHAQTHRERGNQFEDRGDRDANDERDQSKPPKPRAVRKPRAKREDAGQDSGLSADMLPPSIGVSGDDEKPKRKPRVPRKPRALNDEQATAAE